MSTYSPLLFKSGNSGAPALSGTVGALISVLDHVLIVGSVFTTPDDAAFTDRTAEARLAGGTAFPLLPTPATGDRCYIGTSVKFGRCRFTLATLGVGGTYVLEYWNGSAWTTLTVADGTSGFAASGVITWTPPANWAANSVNGVTQFWIRVRATVLPSTNPTVGSLSITGWQQAFVGTNQADYQQGGGNQFYVSVNDNAPGAGLAKEARSRGFEAMSALGTGTGPFPTAVQLAAGIVLRKSLTADATARTWVAIADDRTVYLFVRTADTANVYFAWGFGDLFSLVAGDGFRTAIIGRDAENIGTMTNENFGRLTSAGAAMPVLAGHYLARAHTGLGSAIQFGKHGDVGKDNANEAFQGIVPYPNPADGGLYLSPVWAYQGSQVLRGRLRGVWEWLHVQAAIADGDTFQGSGALAGKSFIAVLIVFSSIGLGGDVILETTDTWETN